MVKRATHKRNLRSSRHARTFTWIGVAFAVVAASIIVAVHASRSGEQRAVTAAARPIDPKSAHRGLPVVDVYKSPTCGCCAKWVEHLRNHGFTVRTTDMTDLAPLKASHGVPRQVESCHTALVDGYVLEGHVPAADVQRLLKDRPTIAGLAVGGMPVGSPGMEVAGAEAQRYDVMSFEADGSTRVFATHN